MNIHIKVESQKETLHLSEKLATVCRKKAQCNMNCKQIYSIYCWNATDLKCSPMHFAKTKLKIISIFRPVIHIASRFFKTNPQLYQIIKHYKMYFKSSNLTNKVRRYNGTQHCCIFNINVRGDPVACDALNVHSAR